MNLLYKLQQLRRELFPGLTRIRVLVWYMTIRNRFSPVSVLSATGPVVSLTTHGSRIHKVHLAIESIGCGRMRPSRMVLWLDNDAAYQNRPPALRRLERRGLEICLCNNFGPHAKYYPYVQSEAQFSRPLVTADDDILYPRFWLHELYAAFRESPGTINCNFARRVRINARGIDQFSDWQVCQSAEPSFRNHALGIYGVIYPPKFLAVLKRVGAGFFECCPKADDLWLHVQAIRAGFKIRQISPQAVRFLDIPGTGDSALWNENGRGENDAQAKKTYSADDIEILRQEPVAA